MKYDGQAARTKQTMREATTGSLSAYVTHILHPRKTRHERDTCSERVPLHRRYADGLCSACCCGISADGAHRPFDSASPYTLMSPRVLKRHISSFMNNNEKLPSEWKTSPKNVHEFCHVVQGRIMHICQADPASETSADREGFYYWRLFQLEIIPTEDMLRS